MVSPSRTPASEPASPTDVTETVKVSYPMPAVWTGATPVAVVTADTNAARYVPEAEVTLTPGV